MRASGASRPSRGRIAAVARRLSPLLALLASGGCAQDDAQTRMIANVAATARGIGSIGQDAHFARAVAAERSLRRGWFVPADSQAVAYLNQPLTIGFGQTISDPYIVAVMTAAARVEPGARVLEIGTGSGYQAAVLARLGARVWTVEIVPELARRARAVLRRRRIGGVDVRAGDGFRGWPEQAPFDAILVTAGTQRVPAAMLDQLAVAGRLVIPVGRTQPDEQILVYRREAGGTVSVCTLGPAPFVPLTGEAERQPAAGEAEVTPPFCFGGAVT